MKNELFSAKLTRKMELNFFSKDYHILDEVQLSPKLIIISLLLLQHIFLNFSVEMF